MHKFVELEEILFFVPDVTQAKRWYMKLLEADPTFDDPNYCTFQVGRITIGLHPSDSKTASGVAGQVAYWRVENLSSTIDHFVSHGCTVFRGPIVGIDGPQICQVKDPHGNVWGFVERS